MQSPAQQTLSWSGGGGPDANWSNGANWGFSGTPANGDTLIFSSPKPNQINTNDLVGLVIDQIRFIGTNGGYSIRGNAFTITNIIQATNTAGVNSITNAITFGPPTVTVNVGSNATLTLAGALSGSTGLTKTGLGTLTFSGTGANSYSGTTLVNGGLLQLAKTVPDGAMANGPLTISNAIVREILGSQLGAIPLTIIGNFGVLDLNGNTDAVGSSLTFRGGAVSTGAGSLNLGPNLIITVTNGTGDISGNIHIGSGTCTIQADQYLSIAASVNGTADIVKNGTAEVDLFNPNTYTGLTTINDGQLWVVDNLSLGGTNAGTIVNGNATFGMAGCHITNESLTINSPTNTGAFQCNIASDWAGPVTLGANVVIRTDDTLRIDGAIAGSGGFTKTGPNVLTLKGATTNTYAGPTTVDVGTLELNKVPLDGAIPHDLIINNGTVRNLRENQIFNLSTVTIGASGALDVSTTQATNNILGAPVNTLNGNNGNYTLGYAFTPNANLKVTHVRHYFGQNVKIWDNVGNLLASQNVVSTPGTWVETALATPITLNAGVRYRVSAYSTNGYHWRTDMVTNFPYGTVDQGYELLGDVFPTTPDIIRWWFVDLRYAPLGGEGVGSINGSGSVNLGSYFLNSFDTGAHTYDGVISGTGGEFYVSGSGLNYTLNSNNTYSGQTVLTDSAFHSLRVNGSQPKSAVYVGVLSTLSGSGTVGNITNKSILAPGNGGPGMLTCSNVIIAPSGFFTVEINGPTAGVDYDQLNVRGTCFITNAGFGISFNFTKPVAVGQEFVIINNDGAETIKGNFNTWGGGATWTQNGFTAAISYVGGTGNDVSFTLTAVPGAAVGSVVTSGNGDGAIAPNECNYLGVVITNKTGTPMTGVTAKLTSQTHGVIVADLSVPYPNVPGNGKSTNSAPFQISTTPGFVCGSNINLTLTVSSSLGGFIVPLTIPTGVPSVAPVRFDNNTTIALSDISTNESTNFVATWTGGPITKVAVSLWLSEPLDSDVSLTLIAPNGATVDLSSGNGGGANFGTAAADGSRTLFDDAAGTSITAGAPPFVGAFKPEAPLSALIGTTPVAGNWRLRVADPFFFGAPGTLRNWSLFLYGTDCGTGSGLCELCPNVALTSALGPNSLTQSNYVAIDGGPSVCGVSKACPGTAAISNLPSELFTFHNGPSDACITVGITNISITSGMVVSAHSGGFAPGNPDKCANYLGDLATVLYATQSGSFAINVASNATFVVNVIGADSGSYGLTVTGGDCRPALSVTDVGGGNAKLDWSTAAAGYQLESTNALPGATVWPTITNTPAVINSRYTVTNTVPAANQFYHLRKPLP